MLQKHFVIFLTPGSFWSEETSAEIDSWNETKALKIMKDKGCKPFAFYFITKGREENELDSKVIRRSGTYFVDGKLETLEQIEADNNPDNKILISNMKCNGWNIVVKTPYGNYQPFKEKDQIVRRNL